MLPLGWAFLQQELTRIYINVDETFRFHRAFQRQNCVFQEAMRTPPPLKVPPNLCPGSLQELIRAPGARTMRKWASISTLAINFPGTLHGFSSEGWNSIGHTWICQARPEVLQKKDQTWFEKPQMRGETPTGAVPPPQQLWAQTMSWCLGVLGVPAGLPIPGNAQGPTWGSFLAS